MHSCFYQRLTPNNKNSDICRCTFNGIYSRDNIPDKIKDRAYIINLNEYSDTGTHWTALYALNDSVTYFDSFGVEHVPKEIQKFIKESLINKSTIERSSITKNIYRIQAYDSVMCGYCCIGFTDFMLKGKSLTDFANFFSPNNFKKVTI